MLLALFNHKMFHLSLFLKKFQSQVGATSLLYFRFATQITQALDPDRIDLLKGENGFYCCQLFLHSSFLQKAINMLMFKSFRLTTITKVEMRTEKVLVLKMKV